MPVLIVVLQIVCCLGFGSVTLRILRLSRAFEPALYFPIAFTLGFGILGWILFPLGVAGLIGKWLLLGILLLGSAGLFWSRFDLGTISRPDGAGLLLLVLLGVIGAFDFMEALTPPSEADSLAYHFAAPKRFLDAGKIYFVFRPLDGSIPYLVQMTYMPVFSLGGETALTMWTFFTNGVTGFLLFALSRRHMSSNWSLLLAVIFLTTPVVIFAGGSGQVEVRLSLFVMVAAFGVANAVKTGHLNYAILAGLSVGFYAGSKYMGLLFAVACGFTILIQRRWLLHGLVLTAVAIFVGSQWYLWNAIHTGDPFFPVFFEWLGKDGLTAWTKDHHKSFSEYLLSLDRGVPINLWWFILLPFKATLDPIPTFDALRAGLGPFWLLILPMALWGALKNREKLTKSPLFKYGLIFTIFYALWFFSGPSQRIRHLLPIYPLILICLMTPALLAMKSRLFKSTIVIAFVLTLSFQLTAHGVASLPYARYLVSNFDRDRYLTDNISRYSPVPWINSNLTAKDKLLLSERQLFYYLDVPYLFGSSHSQSLIDLRPGNQDAQSLLWQMKSAGITHILLKRVGSPDRVEYDKPYQMLQLHNCFERLYGVEAVRIQSRSLKPYKQTANMFHVVRLKYSACIG